MASPGNSAAKRGKLKAIFPESKMEMLNSGIPLLSKSTSPNPANHFPEAGEGQWRGKCERGGYHWRSPTVSHLPALGQTPTEQQTDNCTSQAAQPVRAPREQLCPGELLTQPCCKSKSSITWGEKGFRRQGSPIQPLPPQQLAVPLPPVLQRPSILLH